MRLTKYLLAVTLIFIVMIFWVGKVAAYDMTQYICSLHQGDWWEGLYTYSVVGGPADGASGSYSQKLVINGTELVNGVETIKREFLVNESVDSYYCVALESEGFKLYKEYQPAINNYFIFDPPPLVSPATFDVGDVRQSSYSVLVYSIATDAHLDTAPASWTVSFESVEDVPVPYGTFEDCLKISYSSSSQSPTSGIATKLEETSWYAHRVGKVKQETTMSWYNIPEIGDIETTSTWELTDYDVNFPSGCEVSMITDSMPKSRWVPLPAVMKIQTANFDIRQRTRVTYTSDVTEKLIPSVIPLVKLVNQNDGIINQFAIIMPAIVTANFYDDNETITVAVEGCDQTCECELNILNLGSNPPIE
jgi:hypothetical protein